MTLSDESGYVIDYIGVLKENYDFLRIITTDALHDLNEESKKNGRIYVRFIDPASKRFGSIGWIGRNNVRAFATYKKNVSLHASMFLRYDTVVNFDGNRSATTQYEPIEWIPNYQGEVVYKFDRSRNEVSIKAEEPIFDRIGQEIKINDFCSYILYQFDNSRAAGIYYGNVTKITNGDVYCTNVTLGSEEKSAEKKVKSANLITIITDDLMDKLVMAKLKSA